MKTRIFGTLAVVLSLALLEIGSFLLLSFSAGETQTYSDLRALRDERQIYDQSAAAKTDKNWQEHRIARPPALHPFIGYVPNPVGHPRAENPTVSHESLEYGFPLNRVDLFRSPAENEVVIGIFGGSMAANLGAGGRRLEEFLQEHMDRFSDQQLTVLTFAVAGHKQPQQLMALNYLLALGIHLDVVINLDGFNDIALSPVTNIPQNYNAFYPRGWLLMVDDLDQDQRIAAGELTYLRQHRAERAALFSRAPWRHSLTAGLVWKVLDARQTSRITHLEHSVQGAERSPSANYQARGPRKDYASDDEMYDDLAAFWKRSSQLMHGACQSRGIEYFHFLQPNQYLPGSKPLSAEEQKKAWVATQAYRPAVEQAYPRLISAGAELRREGVPFFDLTQIYSNIEKTVYRDACCHVNYLGQKTMAQAMAKAMDNPKADTAAERRTFMPGGAGRTLVGSSRSLP